MLPKKKGVILVFIHLNIFEAEKKKENYKMDIFSILIADYIFLIFYPKRDERESLIEDDMKLRLQSFQVERL